MSWELGAAIGGNIIGGFMAQDAQRSANKANARQAEADRMMQREFAQHGVRWKVADARAAGISPLVALGMNPISASPSAIGAAPETGMADAVANMGQDVSRSIQATRTAEERQLANLQLANAKADLDGKTIDNQIRASTLQKMNQTGPAFPSAVDNNAIPGQGDSNIPGFKVMASEAAASSRHNTGTQAGAINSLQYVRETDGSLGVAPSKDVKERIEDDFIGESLWHLRNRVSPPAPSTKEFPLPKHLVNKGYKYWLWNPFKQAFVPSKNP